MNYHRFFTPWDFRARTAGFDNHSETHGVHSAQARGFVGAGLGFYCTPGRTEPLGVCAGSRGCGRKPVLPWRSIWMTRSKSTTTTTPSSTRISKTSTPAALPWTSSARVRSSWRTSGTLLPSLAPSGAMRLKWMLTASPPAAASSPLAPKRCSACAGWLGALAPWLTVWVFVLCGATAHVWLSRGSKLKDDSASLFTRLVLGRCCNLVDVLLKVVNEHVAELYVDCCAVVPTVVVALSLLSARTPQGCHAPSREGAGTGGRPGHVAGD